MMLSENVLVQLVIVVGSVLTTYLTVKYKNRVVKSGDTASKEGSTRTRMDVILDGYEKLIKQQQQDIERKEKQLLHTQALIERLQKEIDETRRIVQQQQEQLNEQKRINDKLKEQLGLMREDSKSLDSFS